MWSKNNRAHTTTWIVLRLLNQGLGVFKDSGTVKMNQLFYWSSAAGAKMRAVQARSLAAQIDNMFRGVYGAAYEAGVNTTKAMDDMVTVLLAANKTVEDLAESSDANYLFWKEDNDV